MFICNVNFNLLPNRLSRFLHVLVNLIIHNNFYPRYRIDIVAHGVLKARYPNQHRTSTVEQAAVATTYGALLASVADAVA